MGSCVVVVQIEKLCCFMHNKIQIYSFQKNKEGNIIVKAFSLRTKFKVRWVCGLLW